MGEVVDGKGILAHTVIGNGSVEAGWLVVGVEAEQCTIVVDGFGVEFESAVGIGTVEVGLFHARVLLDGVCEEGDSAVVVGKGFGYGALSEVEFATVEVVLRFIGMKSYELAKIGIELIVDMFAEFADFGVFGCEGSCTMNGEGSLGKMPGIEELAGLGVEGVECRVGNGCLPEIIFWGGGFFLFHFAKIRFFFKF